MGGVTVGENAVVAAGSVVTRGVPPQYSDRWQPREGHSLHCRLRKRPAGVGPTRKLPHVTPTAVVIDLRRRGATVMAGAGKPNQIPGRFGWFVVGAVGFEPTAR
ncbi:hypothetical protein [Acidisphaera sp. S103]|uniref:hypothetical protein n=1 Tax=Acidisphaera sp. S103 TaxID=1747223 RepID=UPI00352E7DFF